MSNYSDDQLLELFRNGESDLVERKREAKNSADKIKQAICAFANDLPRNGKPGVIFVGQEDDGSCAGLKIDDDLLAKIGGWRNDGTFSPFPSLRVFDKMLDNCEVAVIEVFPSTNPPVRYDGRTWIRVGPRRAIATPEEERRLTERRQSASLPFDALGVQGATMDDIDLVRFRLELLPALVPNDVLSQNQRTLEEQLASLRFLTLQGSATAAGLLLCGKNPQVWFPGAYVQFLRVDGTELTDPLRDRHEIMGSVLDQLRRLDELVSLHVSVSPKVGGALRADDEDVPELALRQLVRNAILHRTYEGTNAPVRVTWYTDRVEVQSPGGPYGQVTVANFGQSGVTDYRNPTLAQLLHQLRFVERFGVGIQLARKALSDNGNPELELIRNEQHVLAIVRSKA